VIQLRIGGVESVSTIDWPGKVSTVFFCAGCNYRCIYCHNHTLIPKSSGEEWEIDKIIETVEYNEPLIDGIVFTGGEPTFQNHKLIKTCRALKDEFELPIMIDTNGSNSSTLAMLYEENLVDRVAIDVKAAIIPFDYTMVTGVPGHDAIFNLFKSIKMSKLHGVEIEIRTTVVPRLSNEEYQIESISKAIRPYADEYYLQQFNNTNTLNPVMGLISMPTREELISLAHSAKMCGVKRVYIRTVDNGLEEV